MTTSSQRRIPRLVLAASASALAAALIFYPTLQGLWLRWMEPDSYFVHGPLVPLVSAWMIWRRREALSREEAGQGSATWGAALLVLALAIHLLCAYLQFNFGMAFGLVLWIVASVGFLFGTRVLWALRFPLAYLLLALPIPSFLIASLTLDLRELSTQLSGALLGLVLPGFEMVGNRFYWAANEVVVTDACSGLRTLVTTLAVTGAMAELETSDRRGWIVFLAAAPAAIFANTVRICLFSALVHFGHSDFANGPAHEWIGLFTFILSLATVSVLGAVAGRFFDRPQGVVRSSGTAPVSLASLMVGLSRRGPVFSIILIGFMLAQGLVRTNPSLANAPVGDAAVASAAELRTPLIPVSLGSWSSEDVLEDREETMRVLGTRDLMMRAYTNPSADAPVYLYVVHDPESRKVAHPPDICYLAEGYEQVSHRDTVIRPAGMDEIPVNEAVFTRDGYTLLVHYWFRIDGVDTRNYVMHQLRSLLSLSPSAERGSSMFRISTPVTESGLEAARLRTGLFRNELLPAAIRAL